MSNWSDIRREFYKEAIRYGFSLEGLSGQLRAAYPIGWNVELPVLERWLKKLHRPPKIKEDHGRRLVNRFKLGADPEFILWDGENRQDASRIGLMTSLAFGSDTNGRLVELRPYPSRSALVVTASILATMRWLALLYPATRQYSWLGGAFKLRDGIGGHIHFGRKRRTREQELTALDAVYAMLCQSGMFNLAEIAARQQGDAHGQRYGLPHDFRLQAHGYEYRSFPSWLDSPWMTFFVLTLSKLAVFNPELVVQVRRPEQIANLLAYYRGVDDDARLAFKVLQASGLPKESAGNSFKDAWGIHLYSKYDKHQGLPRVIPQSITPGKEDVKEMLEHLMTGKVLSARVPVPTWAPVENPKGFVSLADHITTVGVRNKGMGEIVWDLVTLAPLPATVTAVEAPNGLYVTSGLIRQLARDWRKSLPPGIGKKVTVISKSSSYVGVGSDWRKPQHVEEVRALLTCGAFPFWKRQDAKDPKSWKETARKKFVFKSAVIEEYGMESLIGGPQ